VDDVVVGLVEVISLIGERPLIGRLSVERLLFVLIVTALMFWALMISVRMAIRWGGNDFARK